MAHVDLILAASIEDMLAEGVLADETGGEEREWGAGSGEVDQDVVSSPAGPFGLAADVGELLGLGIDIDHFDQVNDPVASGEEATTFDRSCIFHGGKAAECGRSE